MINTNAIPNGWHTYTYYPRPSICPGCRRCRECGRGPYIAPYPSYPSPYYPSPLPTGPVWISNGGTIC